MIQQTVNKNTTSTTFGLVLFGIFLSALLFSSPGAAQTRESLTMYLGEVQVLKIGMVERVAIGNPTVASNSILPQGQLVILADSVGVTTMHIWRQDGSEKDFEITVLEKKTIDRFGELKGLLQHVQGVTPVKVGDLIVVQGSLAGKDRELYERIMQRYSGVLDLATPQSAYTQVAALLQDIPGLDVKNIGGQTVLSGEIGSEYDKLIQIVAEKYPQMLNLTRPKKAVAGKMIYMKVKIMEVNKSVTENLGIDWNLKDGFLGPSFEFGVESVRGGATILNGPNTANALKKAGKTDLTSASGYFGVATGLFSTINLLESNGDAVLLAEPRLSTRSGGKAEFLAGGEIPYPVTAALGQTNVEFKKYGILLNIEPVVDDDDNILAHIETEISTPDKANEVLGIPGILKRTTSTDISMRAQETLVIAGLLNDQASMSYDGVKWLQDVPVLGPLFRSEKFNNQKTELLIFVTPYIYDVTSKLNKESLKEVDRMQNAFNNIVKGNELLLD